MFNRVRLIITIGLLVAAMVMSGYLGLRQRIGIVLLVLLSLVWFTVDRLWEGGTLVHFSERHGLVTADLVGVAGLGAAAWLIARRRRRR